MQMYSTSQPVHEQTLFGRLLNDNQSLNGDSELTLELNETLTLRAQAQGGEPEAMSISPRRKF